MDANPLGKDTDPVTLWGNDPSEDYFYMEDEEKENVERFKLLLTTEEAEAFLLEQEPIEKFGEILEDPSFRKIGKLRKKEKVKNDWFTKSLTVKVKRA